MSTLFHPPAATQRPVPLHKAALPQTVFVDRQGDEWVPNGHTPSGELLLTCPQPSNPEDCGEGQSFAWTYHLVQAAFGPLMGRTAVQR